MVAGWGAIYDVVVWFVLFIRQPVHPDFRIFYVAAEAGLRYGWSKSYDVSILRSLSASFPASQTSITSKQSLLEAVVERSVDSAMAALAPVLGDPDLPALRKLEGVFAGIARWKAERKDLVLAIMEVWNSDGNAIIREKLRRMTVSRMAPLLSAVVRQGVDEGVFSVVSPDETATVFVSLMQGFQEVTVDHFIARQAGTVTFQVVRRSVASFTEAFERILGIPQGSLTLTDEPTLRFWFG